MLVVLTGGLGGGAAEVVVVEVEVAGAPVVAVFIFELVAVQQIS